MIKVAEKTNQSKVQSLKALSERLRQKDEKYVQDQKAQADRHVSERVGTYIPHGYAERWAQRGDEARRKRAGNALRKLGLRLEDCIWEEETQVLEEAIRRLPMESQVAREKRKSRALDVSFKRKDLPEWFREQLINETFNNEIFCQLSYLKQRQLERDNYR